MEEGGKEKEAEEKGKGKGGGRGEERKGEKRMCLLKYLNINTIALSRDLIYEREHFSLPLPGSLRVSLRVTVRK